MSGVVSHSLWQSRCFSSSSHANTKRKAFFGPLDPYLIALLSIIYTLLGPNTASEVATHLCYLQTLDGKKITVLFVSWKKSLSTDCLAGHSIPQLEVVMAPFAVI